MRNTIVKLTIFVFFSLTFLVTTSAQSVTSLECGQSYESELRGKNTPDKFVLSISAGTSITIRAEPIGASLNPYLYIYDTAGNNMLVVNSEGVGQAEVINKYTSSASNPILWVTGDNPDHIGLWITSFAYNGSLGAYTLSLGCTLRDGTVINPGESASAPNTNSDKKPDPAALAFSGTGFPGLAPVDFVDAVTTDLNLGQATKGKLPAGGNAVLGYTFDAAANDNLALSFNRVSGNLNLGLVVLSADNKVIFQASLVTASKLSAEFTLPTAGIYTIGIYRIDLLPPDAPEATAFQITATLNP